MREADRSGDELSAIVGTAMPEKIPHLLQQSRVYHTAVAVDEHSREAAHGSETVQKRRSRVSHAAICSAASR